MAYWERIMDLNYRFLPLLVMLCFIAISPWFGEQLCHCALCGGKGEASCHDGDLPFVVCPSEVEAGQIISQLKIFYQTRSSSNELHIELPGMLWFNRGAKPDELSPLFTRVKPQFDDESAPGYVGVESEAPKATIESLWNDTLSRSRMRLVVKTPSNWQRGEKLVITIRDARAQPVAGRIPVRIIEAGATHVAYIDVMPLAPLSMIIHGTVKDDNIADIRVVAHDAYGNRAFWDGPLNLLPLALLPGKPDGPVIEMTMEKGLAAGSLALKPGDCYRLVSVDPPFPTVPGGPVISPGDLSRFISEDRRVQRITGPDYLDDLAAMRLLWGDPHTHTAESDAYWDCSPAQVSSWARDTGCLDFVAITDHAEIIWGHGLSHKPDAAERILLFARSFSDRNFTVIPGYEWTPGDPAGYFIDENQSEAAQLYSPEYIPGHLTVLFPGDIIRVIPWTPSGETGASTPEQLSKMLRDTGAMAVPHHIGADFAPWQYRHWHDELMSGVEIVSAHGIYEEKARKGLALGLIDYFIGGSDSHMGRPGIRKTPGYHRGLPLDAGGITWVWADSMEAHAILEAISDGRCGATTGPRMIMVACQVEKVPKSGTEAVSKSASEAALKPPAETVSIPATGISASEAGQGPGTGLFGLVMSPEPLEAVEIILVYEAEPEVSSISNADSSADYSGLSNQETLEPVTEKFSLPLETPFLSRGVVKIESSDVPARYYLRAKQKNGEIGWTSPRLLH